MKIALVTGTNRGIGHEITKQLSDRGDFTIIATGRDLTSVEHSFADAPNIVPMKLDTTVEKDAIETAASIDEKYGQLDILINNAGIIGNDSMQAMNLAEIRTVMETNFFGPIQAVKAMMPLLKKSADARIINMSSGMGEMAGMLSGGYAAYRLSKWSLNGFTMLLGGELENSNIKVFSMCPGWVRTDMGGAGAPRNVTQGADTAVWLATAKNPQTAKFYRDRKVIPW